LTVVAILFSVEITGIYYAAAILISAGVSVSQTFDRENKIPSYKEITIIVSFCFAITVIVDALYLLITTKIAKIEPNMLVFNLIAIAVCFGPFTRSIYKKRYKK
jgi:hypothetical protein